MEFGLGELDGLPIVVNLQVVGVLPREQRVETGFVGQTPGVFAQSSVIARLIQAVEFLEVLLPERFPRLVALNFLALVVFLHAVVGKEHHDYRGNGDDSDEDDAFGVALHVVAEIVFRVFRKLVGLVLQVVELVHVRFLGTNWVERTAIRAARIVD